MNRSISILCLIFVFSCLNTDAFSQTVDQVEKTERELEKEKKLLERILRPVPATEIEEPVTPGKGPSKAPEGQAFLKEINVIGSSFVSEKEINRIIEPYLDRQVSVAEMEELAAIITETYRRKGFVTSRAYIPPQKIDQGVLEIRVLEVTTGNIEIRGNKYFKERIYEQRVGLKTGDPFNYNTLRRGLKAINELPDRYAKAVLAPGTDPATTDVIVNAEDCLPIHVGMEWDNYGTRYVDKDRIRTTLTHNNLLGFDDACTMQFQTAEGENYTLASLRYLFPVIQDTKIGFFYANSKIDLRQEYEEEDLNARGKTQFFSLYVTQPLYTKENVSLRLNVGFDYKDIFNFQQGLETSRDRMRVAKTSLDLDVTDEYGRTIANNEMSWGIKSIMGGLEGRDGRSSRSGAGGEFFKNVLGLLRLQRLPYDAALLWKNQFQYTTDILTSAEQFQVGGIINVRGYPAAEIVGDRGFSSTLELSTPCHLISKDVKVPYSEAKLYDALRIIMFYDWGYTRLRRPTATEENHKTLKAAGCGLRLFLPEDFSIKAEFAWPLDNTPSDGDHLHAWLAVSKTF
ncbi:MAG: hypothetical protein DRP74_04565 [Candidatus Omnitrophota bacterium]|nr:MAG: hypothetical protein DRP74_04565 [Candidatus Omnitrophota bacterium]